MRRAASAKRVRVSALAAALAVTACGTTSVTTDHVEQPKLESYGSYFIAPGPVMTDDAVTAVPDQLVQDRIDAELGQELGGRGLDRVEPWAADLIVTYTAQARDLQQVVYDDFGLEPWPFNGDVWVKTYRETTLVIDVLDAETHRPVWRATARTKNKDFHDPQFVSKIVNRAMKDFPPLAQL